MLLLTMFAISAVGLKPLAALAALAGVLALGQVSFAPKDAVESGLIDDVDVTVKETLFVIWDYNGKADRESTALGMVLVDSEGKEHTQYFSVGDPKFFVPNEDGSTLVPTTEGGKSALSSSSNFVKLMESLVNCGFPESKLEEGNIKVLEGMECHIQRVPAPKRTGLIRTHKEGDREQTVLIVSKIHKLPWDTKSTMPPKASGLGVKKATPSTPTSTAGRPTTSGLGKSNAPTTTASRPNSGATTTPSADVDAKATETLMVILGENGGTIAKAKLPAATFKAMGADPMKGAVTKRLFDDAFLSSAGDGAWVYDGANISFPA